MSTTVSAYGATSATDPLSALEIERRDVGPNDVRIDIKFCGICHSDIHTVRGEWGDSYYPIVPGHEIAGIVAEVGSDVKEFKEGDRVGVGCMVDSCLECEHCKNDEEQYCIPGMTGTYGTAFEDGSGTQGGYSQQIVVKDHFVCTIPEGISLEVAAPLLCAGITTYSPLHHWNAGPGKRVGVVGMGGLGHLAVKIAVAMGADVSVLSQSRSKEEDGRKFGAKNYYATKEEGTLEELSGTFDLIINTVSAKLPIDDYLALLDVNGSLVNVGAPPEPLDVNVFSLLSNRRSYAGSMIGGIKETQEMLDFCAEHGIGAEIEVIGADKINEAYDRVLDSDVRYRFVIDVGTIAT